MHAALIPLLLAALVGCSTSPPKPDTPKPLVESHVPPHGGYWVPMLAQDGVVYELEITARDDAEGRIIMCVPIDETTFRCLYQRNADGAYGFVTIFLQSDDPKAGT